jgi:hypothetical protein
MKVCSKCQEFNPTTHQFEFQGSLAKQTMNKLDGKPYYCPIAAIFGEEVHLLTRVVKDEHHTNCCSVCEVHFADMDNKDYQKQVRQAYRKDK